MRKLFGITLFFFLCGCSTAATIENLEEPLAAIKRSVADSLPIGFEKSVLTAVLLPPITITLILKRKKSLRLKTPMFATMPPL
ncbi:MAG: hypothetical protein R2827_03995 [Bdellovibrionales bacterium]